MKKSTPRSLPEFVRSAIEKSGLDKEEAAAKLGVARSVLSQWTTGRTFPSDDHLRALAQWTGDDPDALIASREATRFRQRMERYGYDVKLISSFLAA